MLILNPNPCIDVTIWVKELVRGSVHRAIENKATAGGKGINVARACQTMGLNPHLYLTLPDSEGPFYKELLDSEGHDVQYLSVPGEVRKSIIVNEESSSAITILNGAGPTISTSDWEKYCKNASTKVSPGELVLMMGSLPKGHPDSALDQLAIEIRSVGGLLLVDTSPATFVSRKNQILDFISPNLEEAEAIIENKLGDLFIPDNKDVEKRALAAAEKLFNKVAKNVIVTAGAQGCAFKNEDEHFWLPAYKIDSDKYKSAVGAGDSFVAGFAMNYEKNTKEPSQKINWKSAIKYGMATAAASCETYRAGGFEKKRVLGILGSDAGE